MKVACTMTDEEQMRESFVSIDVNPEFSEAVVVMRDDSRLCFRHRVGDRSGQASSSPSLADVILNRIAKFRLNGKHLDVTFADGSRWEVRFSR